MFENFDLKDWMLSALTEKGITAPTEIQRQCIPLIAGGSDVFGRSQTGSGKTFAFGLPALNMADFKAPGVETLVVCPTRELASQVTSELRSVGRSFDRLKIAPIYGGADMSRQIKALKVAKIVVGTPGRLMDHLRRRTLKLDSLKLVVLDEADEMLNMGFRGDIETILKSAPKVRQTVMFSATMPPAIRELMMGFMSKPVMVEIGALNSSLGEITQCYARVPKAGKLIALKDIFRIMDPVKCIVFCNTKAMVEDVSGQLREAGINVFCLHGDLRQSQRKRVMDEIRGIERFALVATDVAARGIDIKDIDHIINYDIPKDVEIYLHRIGRTGRAGKCGTSISIVNTPMQYSDLVRFGQQTKSELKELKEISCVAAADIEASTMASEKRASSRGGRPMGRASGERKESDRKPRAYGTREESDRKPRVYGNREESDRKPRAYGTREESDRKPRAYGTREESDRKPRVYGNREGSDRKPRVYGNREESDRKPRVYGNREESDRKPRVYGNREESDRKPRAYGTREESDRKPRVYGNREESDRKPRVYGNREESDRKPRAYGNREESDRKPRVYANREESDRKPRVYGNREESDRKPRVYGNREGAKSSGTNSIDDGFLAKRGIAIKGQKSFSGTSRPKKAGVGKPSGFGSGFGQGRGGKKKPRD